MSFEKWRQFCLGLCVLSVYTNEIYLSFSERLQLYSAGFFMIWMHELHDASHRSSYIILSVELGFGCALSFSLHIAIVQFALIILFVMSYLNEVITDITGAFMSIHFSTIDLGFLKLGTFVSAISGLSECFCPWPFFYDYNIISNVLLRRGNF